MADLCDVDPAPTPQGGDRAAPQTVLNGRSWLLVALAFGLSVAAVALLPRAAEGESELGPPIAVLAGTSVSISLICGVAIFVLVRRDLGLGTLTAIYAVTYNALIIGVKFGLSPYGLYDTARDQALRLNFSLDNRFGVTVIAAAVLMLYAAVYGLVFRYFKNKLPDRQPSSKGRLAKVAVVLAALFAGVAGSVLVPTLLSSGAQYLGYVLGSASGLLIGLVLALATLLVIRCFHDTADRTRIAGEAAALSGLFWLGLAFLAMYHVLWVVYILLLTTLWPLKVITPK